jgi:flagella basal body P-ring formation protein FlgA
MMRAWLIGSLLALTGIVLAGESALADPVLKSQVVVERDAVRLGDLFSDLPKGSDPNAEVARAPAPGQRVTLDASALMGIANSQRIGWRPSGRFDKAVVERAGQTISSGAIREAVLAALMEHGLAPGADVALDNERPQITVASDRKATVRAEAVTFDPGKPRFELTLVAPADGGESAERVRIQGKVFRMVDVPVPVRPIANGEVVRARDIQMARLRADQVGATHINDPDKLVDKSARRVLPAGQPVRVSDVANPVLVPKNSMVNVKIASNRLTIVMQGKALEDGSEGEQVRVLNTRSNKIVQGTVNAKGEVVVLTSYSMVSN